MIVLSEPRTQLKESAVKVYCTSCWTDRVITTNGKCKVCGSKLLKPKHWDTTLKKFEIIAKSNGAHICIEIKNQLYIVPFKYLDEFNRLDRGDLEKVGQFIESIKTQCQSFRV